MSIIGVLPPSVNPIVRSLGRDPKTGNKLFQINIALPNAGKFDTQPTAKMVSSLKRRFDDKFPSESLTYEQCHALISFHEYAVECIQAVYGNRSIEWKDQAALIAVAVISRNSSIAHDVIVRSNSRFNRFVERSVVRRTKNFDRVMLLTSDIIRIQRM